MQSLQELIAKSKGLVNLSIKLLVGVALLTFFWGLVRFIFKVGGDEKVEEGRNLMVWGLVALFVMVSVWGIISFLQGELDLTQLGP